MLDKEKGVGIVQKDESYRADSSILGLEQPTDKRDSSGLLGLGSSDRCYRNGAVEILVNERRVLSTRKTG